MRSSRVGILMTLMEGLATSQGLIMPSVKVGVDTI